jgi:hypothetical protein
MIKTDKLALSVAWTRNWKYLLGIFVFPAVFMVGGGQLNLIPVSALLVLFLTVFAVAIWPCIFFKAPVSFGLLAVAAWALGIGLGLVTVIVIHVIRWLATHWS